MFFRKTLTVLATRVVLFVVTFLSSVVIARALGPAGKGQLSLLTTFVGVLGVITGLGINSAVVYYLSHRPEERARIASTGLILQLLLMAATIALALVLLPAIDRFILQGGAPASFVLLSLLLVMPATVLANTLAGFFLGLHDVNRYNVVRALPGVAFLILLVLLAVLRRLDVLSALASYGVAGLCAIGLALYWLWRAGLWLRSRLSGGRALLQYGLKGWLGSITQQFNYRLDTFIVNAFVGVAGVGQYSLAVALAESLWYIPDSVSTVLFPRTAADQKGALSFTPMVARTTLFVTAVVAALLAVISYPFMTIVYGNRFAPAVSPFLVLLPGIVSLSLGKVLANDLAGHGKPEYGTYSSVISLVVTLVLDFLLIPRLGITGAALASTLSYTTSSIALVYLYVRQTGNSPRSVLLIRPSDLALQQTALRLLIARFRQRSASHG